MELWLKHFNSQRTPQFIIGNKHLHKKDLHALNEVHQRSGSKGETTKRFTNFESWGKGKCGRWNKCTRSDITTKHFNRI